MGGKLIDFLGKVGEWLASRHVTPVWPEAHVGIEMAQMQRAQEQVIGDNLANHCAPPSSEEPDISVVLENTGKLALLELLLPPFQIARWEWGGIEFEVAIIAQCKPFVPVPIWRLKRFVTLRHPMQNVGSYTPGIQPLQFVAAFAPEAEWAHDHINAVLAELTMRYKERIRQHEADLKAQALSADQDRRFAVEEYKKVLAGASAAALGDLLQPGPDHKGIVDKMEEMFTAVAD